MNDEERSVKVKLKDKRRYTVWICVFLWVDLLLLTLIVITAYFICSERKLDYSPETNICVPCRLLMIHPDDVIEGLKYKRKTNETCCVDDRKNSDVLVGYFVDHWLKERLAKGDRQFIRYKCKDDSASGASRPTIKLVGKEERQSGDHHKVLWSGRSETALLPDNKDISHHKEHGLIEIKKAGLYQIYTQVVLNRDMYWYNKHHKTPLYQHYVIRIEAGQSDTREKIILKSSNSYCWHKTDKQTVTSYLGGAFQLAKGDKLAVKIHHKTEIVPTFHMNFFGAHML